MRRAINILYVEDDDADVDLVRTALKHIDRHDVAIEVAGDGEQALDRVNRPGGSRPDLVLLDLNLPRIHGREVLNEIRSAERWKTVPVLILSTSKVQDDVDEAYALGATAYVVKPADFHEYKAVMKSICDFWFEHVAYSTAEARKG